MGKILKIKHVKVGQLYALGASQTFNDLTKALVRVAQQEKTLVACDIGNREEIVFAMPDSDPDLLARDLWRSNTFLLDQKIIGPYPEKNLIDEEEKKMKNYGSLNH